MFVVCEYIILCFFVVFANFNKIKIKMGEKARKIVIIHTHNNARESIGNIHIHIGLETFDLFESFAVILTAKVIWNI